MNQLQIKNHNDYYKNKIKELVRYTNHHLLYFDTRIRIKTSIALAAIGATAEAKRTYHQGETDLTNLKLTYTCLSLNNIN